MPQAPKLTPVWIMFAVETNRRRGFANCFSGRLDEASIRLQDKTTGGEWWGCNGAYYNETEINRSCLNGALAWFCAVDPNAAGGRRVVENNAGFSAGSPAPTFEQFLNACNLQYWPTGGGGGNLTTNP